MKDKELKRESDYLFCISNYFGMENNELLFRYFEHVCMNYIREGDAAKKCFDNSERFYSDSERKIREQYLAECERILSNSS